MKLTPFLAAGALAVVVPTLSWAQAGPELLLSPMEKGLRFDANARAGFFFQRDTQKFDGESVQLQRYNFDGRVRLYPDWEADPRVGVTYSKLDLGRNVTGLQRQYDDLELSAGTGIAKYQGWVAGLVFGAGYAGSNAFGDGNAYFGTATLLVGRTFSENFDIGFALDYNGNRTFMPDTPLPGVVVHTKFPEYNFEASIGFPFTYGRWRPIEPLLLEVNFTFPDFVGARASYDIVKGVGVFASLAERIDAYHDPDLENSSDRVIFYQKYVEAGLRASINDKFTILGALGYTFGQDFRYGFDTRDDHEITKIQDGPYVRLEGQFRF